MSSEKLEQMEIGKGLTEFVNELEKGASSDTALGVPMIGDNYEICLFASRGCKDAKDGKIFSSFCSGNYAACLAYKEKMETDN